MSLYPGQNCNPTACRRKLDKPCLSFYYLVSKFPDSPGLVRALSEVASGIPLAVTGLHWDLAALSSSGKG